MPFSYLSTESVEGFCYFRPFTVFGSTVFLDSWSLGSPLKVPYFFGDKSQLQAPYKGVPY